MNSNAIVIQVQDGSGVRYERCTLVPEQRLLIGRGWDCDVIVQDPQVDAKHGELWVSTDGAYRFRDLESLNGSKIAASDSGEIESGTSIRLGRSRLTIFSTSHTVPPAVEPSRWDAIRRLLEQPLWTGLSLAALMVIALLVRLSETIEPLSADTVVGVVSYLAFALGLWVLFWGVLSKLWRDAMHFRAHLSIAACAGVGAYLVSQVGRFVGWQIQSVDVSELLIAVGEAALLFVTLALTLGVATRLSKRAIFWFSCVPGALLLISIYVLPMLGDEDIEWYPTLVSGSYPPSWQLSGSDSLEGFLEKSPSLYESSAKRALERAQELSEL